MRAREGQRGREREREGEREREREGERGRERETVPLLRGKQYTPRKLVAMAMKEKLVTRVPRSGLPLSEMSNVTGSTCIAGATASAALEKFSKKLSVTPSQLTNMTNGTTLPNTSA